MGLPKPKSERIEELTGRDELNLAEFPVALIGKRPAGNVKTMRFQDQVYDRALGEYVTRTLTVTGSDLWGLPTQFDDEVLLACVQLSKEQGFRERRVEFSRYDLLNVLGRATDGRNYKRVSESLDRWAGTLFISDKAWWDKESQSWVKDTFNIIDRVNLVEQENIDRRRKLGEPGKQKSWFMWGDFMWRSFQAGNLKELDYQFWKSLKGSTTKRLYRILDKRFYHKATVTFDLHTLAFEKIGLSRNMHTGQIKEKLRPANNELEKRGVCSGEFVKKERGKWEVVYKKKGKKVEIPASTEKVELADELKVRGVSAKKAVRLIGQYSEERIREKIRLFDWHEKNGQAKQPGFLVSAIEQDYALPEKLTGKSKRRQTKVTAKRVEDPAEAEDLRRAAELKQRLAKLSRIEIMDIENQAVESASPFIQSKLKTYQTENRDRFEALKRGLVEKLLLDEEEKEVVECLS